jgi:hypothetical protein
MIKKSRVLKMVFVGHENILFFSQVVALITLFADFSGCDDKIDLTTL